MRWMACHLAQSLLTSIGLLKTASNIEVELNACAESAYGWLDGVPRCRIHEF